MLNIEKETAVFQKLSQNKKREKVGEWVAKLSQHYGYFRDMEVYIKNHEKELNDDFFNATFQIIVHLAKALEKA